VINYFKFTPVLCAAVAAAAGFYCYGLFKPEWLLFTVIILFSAVSFVNSLALLERKPRKLQLTKIFIIAAAAGFVMGISAAGAGRNNVNFGIPHDKVTAIEGVLLEDPRVISGGRAMAVLSLRKSSASGALRVSSGGRITVFFPEDNALTLRQFGRGTSVFTEGVLRETDTGWVYSAKSMHIVKRSGAVDRMRTGVRLNLISRFEGKSWGGLALALLVGIRDNLDTSLAVLYRDTGLSHILALSGMHLAVLASIIAFLLKKPLGLKLSAVIGAVIIFLYCFLVGPMPSLNRSALMYFLGVFVILGALPKDPMSILALSFLLQIIIAPAEGNTISFILSYLALAGIFIIGQPIIALLSGKAPDFLLQPIAASCGAFLATAAITCFFFGVLIPMGIITGLILVPLTTVFMIGSMIWFILDIFSLSGFLNLPMEMLYQLKEKIVSVAVNVPGITAINLSVTLIVSIALSLAVIVLEYRRRAALLKVKPFE